MIEQDPPVRQRTKKQIEEERLDEEYAKQLQAEDLAREKAKVAMQEEELRLQEELARKIQNDLDKEGFPAPTTLPADRQRELDEISQNFTVEHWDNLNTQVTSNLTLAQTVLGDAFDVEDYVQQMVTLGKQRKRAEAERKAK